MTAFLIKRLGFAVITMFAVMTIVFFVLRILPGDPAYAILGDGANEQSLAALRERLGLNLPLYQQYFDFIIGVFVGDWGTSLVSNRSVLEDIFDVLPATLELTIASLALAALIGIPTGIWSATKRNKAPDYVVRTISLMGLSFPAFVSAVLLLIVFSIQLGWFPVISSGQGESFGERMRDLALPAINLGVIMAAYITRVTRSAMLEVLNQDYVRTAQAKGSSRAVIIYRHCFRNSMIPVVTVIGLYLGILIGNSVLTEIVFNRPGLGKLIIGALNQRDYPMLQGMIVIYTMIVVFVNLLTDLTYGLIDPRIKYK